MDMFCPQCSLVLPPTAQRCTVCGNTATLAPGSVVNYAAVHYTIDSVLGIGGMGIVYKATDDRGNDVVVKQVYVDNPADLPEAQRRFKREATIQAGLNHPAIPRGFGYFADQGFEFMAMEFVPGQDLEKTLAARPGGHMDDDETLELGIQICDGLAVLHNFVDPTGTPAPIIHRDIKPANIILRPNGQICILDLGIARAVQLSAATQVRATRAGTFEYCSSQQVSGMDMSVRDDIYSLAATLFHLRTGQAFAGDFTQRAAEIDQLPPNWRATFRRAIHNDTHLRQRSAADFKQELTNLLPQPLRPGVPAPPPPVVAPAINLPVSVRWRVQRAFMANQNEWQQPVAGQVMQGTNPFPGVNIVPMITDVGPGLMGNNTRGTVVTSGIHGDFGLSIPDVTIPVTVDTREIMIIVEDPATGVELYREPIDLNRPGVAQRFRARGAAGVAGAAHVAAAPFRAVGHGAAVGARGLGRGIAWPFRKIGQGAGAVGNAIGNYLNGADAVKISLVVSGLLALVTFILALLEKMSGDQTWMMYIWVHTIIGAVFAAFLAFRLRKRGLFTTKQRTLKEALVSPVLIGGATLWVAGTLIYWLA